jgi:hypothetical protein
MKLVGSLHLQMMELKLKPRTSKLPSATTNIAQTAFFSNYITQTGTIRIINCYSNKNGYVSLLFGNGNS